MPDHRSRPHRLASAEPAALVAVPRGAGALRSTPCTRRPARPACRCVVEERALGRLDHALQDLAAAAAVRLARGVELDPQARRVAPRPGGSQREPGARDRPQPAPGRVLGLEDAREQRARQAIPVARDGARVEVLHPRPPLDQHLEQRRHPAQHVRGFEPDDGAGHRQPLEEGVEVRADDHRHVARQQEAVDAHLAVGDEGAQGRLDQLGPRQQEQVVETFALRLLQRRGDGRQGRLETDGKEHDLARGVLARDAQAVARRVHDAHVGARGTLALEAARAGGHAHQVAEGAHDHVVAARQGHGAIHVVDRSDAHGAARPGDQPHVRREHVPQSRLGDGVGVGAADLHQLHGPGERARHVAQTSGQGAHGARIAEGRRAAHRRSCSRRTASSIRSRVRRASTSSRVPIA